MNTVQRPRIPTVNYREHPAFSSFSASGSWDNEGIDNLVRKIDCEYTDIESEALKINSDWRDAFNSRVLPSVERLKQKIAQTLPRDPLTADWLHRSLDPLTSQLFEELSCAAAGAHASRRTRDVAELRLLRSNGFTVLKFRDGLCNQWFEACAHYRKALIERANARPEARQWLPLPIFGALSQSIESELFDIGAVDIAAAYRGQPMELDHISLHYSDARQRWYQDCYADVGLPTSQFAYLHNDFEPSILKLLIYLTEVNAEDGPFCYVSGSHLWNRSMTQHVLFKQLDRTHAQVFPAIKIESYYRPRFKRPEERERLMSLPTAFQGSSHMGDDLLDHHSSVAELRMHETPILNADAAILFDGSRGLHRGSLLQHGERWAIQLGYRPKPKRTVLRQAKRVARRLAAQWTSVP
jgi:hypothetical protein